MSPTYQGEVDGVCGGNLFWGVVAVVNDWNLKEQVLIAAAFVGLYEGNGVGCAL